MAGAKPTPHLIQSSITSRISSNISERTVSASARTSTAPWFRLGSGRQQAGEAGAMGAVMTGGRSLPATVAHRGPVPGLYGRVYCAVVQVEPGLAGQRRYRQAFRSQNDLSSGLRSVLLTVSPQRRFGGRDLVIRARYENDATPQDNDAPDMRLDAKLCVRNCTQGVRRHFATNPANMPSTPMVRYWLA